MVSCIRNGWLYGESASTAFTPASFQLGQAPPRPSTVYPPREWPQRPSRDISTIPPKCWSRADRRNQISNVVRAIAIGRIAPFAGTAEGCSRPVEPARRAAVASGVAMIRREDDITRSRERFHQEPRLRRASVKAVGENNNRLFNRPRLRVGPDRYLQARQSHGLFRRPRRDASQQTNHRGNQAKSPTPGTTAPH